MISFTASLEVWTGSDGRLHFLTTPPRLFDEIRAHALANPRGFGSVKVRAAIAEVTWRTSLFPSKGKTRYFLPVRIDICRSLGIAEGNPVKVSLELL